MTVTYTAEVATCRGLGVFWKLLFRWRGSIYKLLWPNLAVYSVCYFTLSAVYRFGLQGEQKEMFEKISLYCRAHSDLIPVSFVLGFYVSIVIKRWWDQYLGIPWPDNLAMFVSTLVHGNDERGRLMRRTILRYVNLCFVVTLSMMCPRVKKRFPTLDHLVDAGFLQPTELKIFEDLDQKTNHPKYWMPLVWAGSIVTRARKEGRVRDDFSMKTLIDGLCTFRGQCGGMLNYDWISIPLVYTQVVTLAVYIFFLATLMGNQFLDPEKNYADQGVDLVVPIFTFLQFFFYMGWLKVAESLVNPFGEDDDDFEVNWLVDRNLQVSYLIVDEMHNEHPELVRDQYWDEVFPAELPYTAAAKQYQTGPPQGSTNLLNIPEDESEFLPMDTVFEESELQNMNDDDDDVIVDMDDIQLDLENGDRKRKETNPMRILMGRKSSVSSKMSVQSSSVVRGGQMNGGSRCRNGEVTEGIGRSLLGLSYSSSTAKTASSSYRQKNLAAGQQSQTVFRQMGRKNSMLSMLTKMFHKEDPNREELRSNHGSNASLRSHRRGGFGRSISRVSCSQANSRTSINRENTVDFQDEIFKMSDLSLYSNEHDMHAAQQRQRKRSRQQYRQGKRKTSVKLYSAETVGDHVPKDDIRVQAVGDETPSTVASTPGEGDKEGMLGRRVWVTKKKGKDPTKETAANEEEGVDDDEDFEDEERYDGEDNGIWFSKNKAQDAEKSSSKRKEEASSSPTKYFRRGDGIGDDLSLVSDSSVKTTYYHGSWETLAESKGIGSITTVTSSPAAKYSDTPRTSNPLTDQGMQKIDKVANDQLATATGHKWLSSESWAGNDKVNTEIPVIGQSLGNFGPYVHHSSARVVVPKKSELPLKHVFEPRQVSTPLQNSTSLALRSRVTSQLARGIAQMAAMKQDSASKTPHEIHSLNINASKANDNVNGVTATVQNSKEKFPECSSLRIPPSDTLITLLAPKNNTGLHVSETYSDDHFTSLPSMLNPSKVNASPPTLAEQIANSTSTKLPDTLCPLTPKQLHLNTDPTSKSPPSQDQDVINPINAKSIKNLLNPTFSLQANNSTFSEPKRTDMVYGLLEDIKRTKEINALKTRDELHEKCSLLGAALAQKKDEQNSDPSHIFQPHIPSTAIPVPSAHDPCLEKQQQDDDEGILMIDDSSVTNNREDAPMDAARPSDEAEATVGRRRIGGLRDFVELEPIEENAEFGGHATSQNGCKSNNEEALDDADVKDAAAPESSV